MVPPQSWPEFKLKKSPGHSVFITVLLNEYFKQRKFPEFVINGWKEENEWIDATFLIDEKRVQVSILSQSALATFCSADYSRSACAVFAANLENVDNWYIFQARMPYMHLLYIGPRLFLLRGLPLATINPHLHPSPPLFTLLWFHPSSFAFNPISLVLPPLAFIYLQPPSFSPPWAFVFHLPSSTFTFLY